MIKYRAWDKQLNELIDVVSVDFKRKVVFYSCSWRFFDEVILMQSTGRYDINGKLIYDKDIIALIKDGEGVTTMVSQNRRGEFVLLGDFFNSHMKWKDLTDEYKMEVIGCYYV